ncbi:VTC domain-containing protein [Formosa sp. Hel1_31_208]|uniref:VTC domain-containing protein n=1 Tax=Formosa sp. Hel1_31_208 TaxID=1798225 RepID=UPI00087BC201|nr:VTC domain-containing protein [Formosa sp. Hel1_31_208]SDR75185.1 VTC domain-containing protein [Formosa sp. Hel1_31_208]
MKQSSITDRESLAEQEGLYLIDKKHNYRFERKFTVPKDFKLDHIERFVKNNSFLFREVFHERQVNNIYFDTAAYNDYFDNVLGVSDRKKIRIRWYGNTFGEIKKPVLEVKIKKGLVGDKWSYKLNPFVLDNQFTNRTIQAVFKQSNLPLPILESTKMVSPTLLNSYSRKYYLSADNRFRITIDFNLLYHKIDKQFNNFNFVPKDDDNKIIELKYALKDDNDANKVSAQFPFRLNKNSKYVNGVNTIKQFPQ